MSRHPSLSRDHLAVHRPSGGTSPLAPGGIGLRERRRRQGRTMQTTVGNVATLADTRLKLASAIGYAARKLWRRKDLEDIDSPGSDM